MPKGPSQQRGLRTQDDGRNTAEICVFLLFSLFSWIYETIARSLPHTVTKYWLNALYRPFLGCLAFLVSNLCALLDQMTLDGRA